LIKDIAVHLTGSNEDPVRLEYASALAERLGAHLTGLQMHMLPSLISLTDPSGSAFLQQLIDDSNAAADAVTANLRNQLAALGPHTELRRLDVFPDAAGNVLAEAVRLADLFVGTQPYGDPARSERIEEAVLFKAGRPCLFLPVRLQREVKLSTVLVGWKNTREAARAVADALPLLQAASLVDVVMVTEEAAELGGADIGRYLSRHGVKAEVRTVPGNPDAAATLLGEARAIRADLIVMGAYGHSRLLEMALGGATRDVLKNATIPVFMAH
jgi:nucleotide-binding universal stress UspA family protein